MSNEVLDRTIERLKRQLERARSPEERGDLLLRIGDLHAKAGRAKEAAEWYGHAAVHCEAEGVLLEAVAVARHAARLVPADQEIASLANRLWRLVDDGPPPPLDYGGGNGELV